MPLWSIGSNRVFFLGIGLCLFTYTSWMLLTDTDGSSVVCRSVCHNCGPCKIGWTDRDAAWDVDLGGPKDHVLDGGPDPHTWRGNFEGEKGLARDMFVRGSIYSKQLSRGRHRYGVHASWGALEGVHIGATWQIQLNRPCVAAMQRCVKLLWSLVCLLFSCPFVELLQVGISRVKENLWRQVEHVLQTPRTNSSLDWVLSHWAHFTVCRFIFRSSPRRWPSRLELRCVRPSVRPSVRPQSFPISI